MWWPGRDGRRGLPGHRGVDRARAGASIVADRCRALKAQAPFSS